MFRKFRPNIRVYGNHRHGCSFNPRPAGVWLVTRPAGGGGGGAKGPLRSPKLLNRFHFQTPFDSPVVYCL